MDDWWPDKPMRSKDYAATNALLLSARAGRAFHEYMPVRQTMAEPGRIYRRISYGPLLDIFMLDLRSYRGPNGLNHGAAYGRDSHLLGPAQLAWLKRELRHSRATWKVIATAAPIGVVDEQPLVLRAGPPRGRAIEIADLLSFMRRAGIENTVWIAADLHYTAAHRYDPAAAEFKDFEPFWEFVSGPLHAGTWRAGALAPTFGPQIVFCKGSTEDQGDNLAPCFGLQFFGHMTIDGATKVMTVALKDVADNTLWSVDIAPSNRLHGAGCIMVSS
jgi:alkaline phosphatase D